MQSSFYFLFQDGELARILIEVEHYRKTALNFIRLVVPEEFCEIILSESLPKINDRQDSDICCCWIHLELVVVIFYR